MTTPTDEPACNVFSRRLLVAMGGLVPALVFARGCSAATTASTDAVSLPDFRRPGDIDDTAALARAFATGRPVHAPAGRYVVGNGAEGQLPPGATLFGDGRDRTVIARSYRAPKPFVLHCDSGSPDPARNIAGIRIRDLTFEDDVARRGYDEFSYLVMLNGVSDALIERVGFRGFRGDGLHLGSSTTGKTERHNVSVTVRDCVFDGVNANNRNGISIIDGADILIEGCQFLDTTRRGDGTVGAGDPMNPRSGLSQPGSIDPEPNDDAFAVIRDVTIRRNRFRGGGGFAVAMLLRPNDAVRVPQHGVVIEDNIIEDRFGGFEAFGFNGTAAIASRRDYGIIVRRNSVTRCDKPFIVDGMRGVTIDANSFVDCGEHGELGYRSSIADIALTGNRFERVGGGAPGFALWVRDAAGIRITGNRFIDCGTPGGRAGVGIAFVAGTARGMTVSDNVFTAPTGRMAQPAMIFREARIDRATLKTGGNDQRIGMPIAAILGAPR